MNETIDLTPTWEAIVPVLLEVVKYGTPQGQEDAKKELLRLARLADRLTRPQPEIPEEGKQLCDCGETSDPHQHCEKCECILNERDHCSNLCNSCAEWICDLCGEVIGYEGDPEIDLHTCSQCGSFICSNCLVDSTYDLENLTCKSCIKQQQKG